MNTFLRVAETIVFAVSTVVAAFAATGSVTVGSGAGIPGREVAVPIYLTLSKDPPFERIVAVVEYPSALAYAKVKTSKDAQDNDVSMQVKQLPAEAGSKKKRLEVTIKADQQKPLQIGMMGSVVFVIDKKAPVQMISLPVIEVKAFPKGGGAEVKLRGDSGSVTINDSDAPAQPLTGCFFFSH